jgi:DNA-binding MarR family transcriptional regulator
MRIEEAIKSSKPIAIHNKTMINIMYTARHIERFASIFKEWDISSPQYNVLRILRGQNGKPANLSTLQERMIDKSSNTTRLVDKLIKNELVSRRVCPQNRRKIEILITSKGMQLLKALDPLVEAHNLKATANLTTHELETLNTLLDKLRTHD